MATIRVAIDNIQGVSADQKTLESFAERLRKAGHTVTTHGVGPNKIQKVMLNNSCDIMIQIAGGYCIGTISDFNKGLGSYYHAKKGGFAFFKCKYDFNTWKAVRAGDDNFSPQSLIAPYLGKTLPEIDKLMPNIYFGHGNTADELATSWINSFGGNSGASTGDGTSSTGGGGSSLQDLIKQVCTDWNHLGVECFLTGDTINIRKTNPGSATPLTEDMIVNNSVSFTDYDLSTPNSYKNAKDQYLIDRFGNIPLSELENAGNTGDEQLLRMAQRNHGHSIDLKVILNPRFVEGKWVLLTLPRYGIEKRPYYISKTSLQDERTMSLTLEPGPPELYVEQTVVEEETEEETETEE